MIWPVVDLAANPTTCVRFDRPAVYLGRSTAQANCPAHLVGRSEGLVLEPLTEEQSRHLACWSCRQGCRRTRDGLLCFGRRAGGGRRTRHRSLRPKTQSAQVAQAAAVAPSVVATGNFTGQAFDACTAPSQSTMDAWLPDYKALGIYIGGGLRACAQPNLTPDWVSANASKGWQFL